MSELFKKKGKSRMSKQFVVGQIGCGAFAVQEHGPNTKRNPHIKKLKWACDVSQAAARSYAEKFGAEKVTTSFSDVTTDPEVDIILVATSHEAHVPIIESAAANGKHIFCEKPMAMDEWQAYQIIRAVRKNKTKLRVNYMRREAPALVALKKKWLEHQRTPKRQPWRYIEKTRNKLVEETTTDFFVRVQDESSTYRMVHLDPFRGGGLIIGEAVHWLDLSCWLFENDRPVEISAWGSDRMRWGIHLKFQSGNAATVIMTPNGSFDYPKEVFEIACDGALFRCEFFLENQYYGVPGQDRELFPMYRDEAGSVGKQGGLAGYFEKRKTLLNKYGDARKIYDKVLPNHGYEEAFDSFINAVVNDTPSPCDELAGYRATYLGHLASKSIELNQPLPIPVEKWDYYVEL
jgi:predicted dehydrogenase